MCKRSKCANFGRCGWLYDLYILWSHLNDIKEEEWSITIKSIAFWDRSEFKSEHRHRLWESGQITLQQECQSHIHQGPHQPRGCLQSAKIISGLYKCNFSLTVEELKLHLAFWRQPWRWCSTRWKWVWHPCFTVFLSPTFLIYKIGAITISTYRCCVRIKCDYSYT